MNRSDLVKISVLKRDFKTASFLFFIYFFFLLNYYFVISEVYDYAGFSKDYFMLVKLLSSLLLTVLMIILSVFIRNDFYKLVYSVSLILFYFGQSIYYVYNNTPFKLVAYTAIPLFLVFFIDKFDSNRVFKRRTVNLSDTQTRLIIILVVLVLMLPFFKYINTVNLKNLLLIDIYSTRSEIKEYDRGIIGYLFSPLSRVILPVLFVFGITKKIKWLTTMSLFSIISLYLLNGAVKSVFFGILCACFFIKGSYFEKEKRFLKFILSGNIVALLTYVSFESYLINDYFRRIFFVPADLFNTYYTYFNNNFTFFNHSRLFSLFGLTEQKMQVSRFIGEYVIGIEGLNANTGIFVEGFISFGTVGVLLFSILFTIFIWVIKKMDFKESYFGIFFTYIYIINTSFIETLLITHGLLFLLFFSLIFIPRRDENLEKYYKSGRNILI